MVTSAGVVTLEREARRTARNGMATGVIMLDVDNFEHFSSPRHGWSAQSPLQAADSALDATKHGGRDRVAVAPAI